MTSPARSLKVIGASLEVTLGKVPKKCPYAEDMRKLITEVLSLAGYVGRWSISPTKQQHGHAKVPKFRFIGYTLGSFTVRLRPAGNDSVWDCELLPLPPHSYDAKDVESDLRRWDGWTGHDDDTTQRQVEARVEVSATGIIDRIRQLEAKANDYRLRQQKIAEMEARYDRMMTDLDDLETAIKQEKEAVAADYEGIAAVAALEQLDKLIK